VLKKDTKNFYFISQILFHNKITVFKMKKWFFPSVIALASCFMGCQNQANNAYEASSYPKGGTEMPSGAMADSVALEIGLTKHKTPSVSKPNLDSKLANRKIIRTATVKSKVKNAEQATYKIEQITKQFGGFVTNSHLESRVLNDHETPISSDSVMQVSSVQISNSIVLRVPNQCLDTLLMELGSLYTFLDSRTVSSNDVTLDFIKNQLKAQIRDNAVKRIQAASDNKGEKLDDMTNAESSIMGMKDAAIDHQIANLETDYNIEYSNVNLEIYQGEIIVRAMKVNPSVLVATSNIGYRFVTALKNGGEILVDVLIGIMNMWAIILGAGLAWWLFRKYRYTIQLLMNTKSSENI
jgi:Domain of unknown function (DUF4349)